MQTSRQEGSFDQDNKVNRNNEFSQARLLLTDSAALLRSHPAIDNQPDLLLRISQLIDTRMPDILVMDELKELNERRERMQSEE